MATGKARKPRKVTCARKITEKDLQTILGIVDGWQDKLTYNKLIEACAIPLRHRYSRTAFYGHERIRMAVEGRKGALKNGSGIKQVKSVELQKALERIARVEAENMRLHKENDALLEMFVRWAHNAHLVGLNHAALNRPLPEIDRSPSRLEEAAK